MDVTRSRTGVSRSRPGKSCSKGKAASETKDGLVELGSPFQLGTAHQGDAREAAVEAPSGRPKGAHSTARVWDAAAVLAKARRALAKKRAAAKKAS
jgi:hypothetical protein